MLRYCTNKKIDNCHAIEGIGNSYLMDTISSMNNISSEIVIFVMLGSNSISKSSANEYVDDIKILANGVLKSNNIIVANVLPVNDSLASSNNYLLRNTDVVTYNNVLNSSDFPSNVKVCKETNTKVSVNDLDDGIHLNYSTGIANFNSAVQTCLK